MDDLISRQAAREALLDKGQSSRRYKLGESWELNWLEIEDALSSIPTIESEPVKHGHWIDGLGEEWHCDNKKLNDAVDCIHDFCKSRKGRCIGCPAYITFRIESGDTVQTCKFRCNAPVNWEHLEIGGTDKV